jgi:hypothetical protein
MKRSLVEVEAENVRLRRELASTKLDLEIVKNPRVRPSYACWTRNSGCGYLGRRPGRMAARFLVFSEPVKKHGLGAARGLESGDVVRRSRLALVRRCAAE